MSGPVKNKKQSKQAKAIIPVELQKAEEVKAPIASPVAAPIPFDIRSGSQIEEERRQIELEERRAQVELARQREAERYSRLLRYAVLGVGVGVVAFLGYRYASGPSEVSSAGVLLDENNVEILSHLVKK